jgi:hypothetical protein
MKCLFISQTDDGRTLLTLLGLFTIIVKLLLLFAVEAREYRVPMSPVMVCPDDRSRVVLRRRCPPSSVAAAAAGDAVEMGGGRKQGPDLRSCGLDFGFRRAGRSSSDPVRRAILSMDRWNEC